ncbi:MAG: transcriptional regulator [Pseudomonadota bacterium]|nr:transcriptional regulator [Pseudomonadota bacterium]
MSAEPETAQTITPEQLRAARTLLNLSSYRLAIVSNTTEGFIYTFEKSGRVSKLLWRPRYFDGLKSIRAALEQAGVEFIDENHDEPGVRLKKS